jgi:hypothetical protein
MKKINFSEFKVWCSEIHSLFSIPKGITMPNKQEQKKYERIFASEAEKSEEELDFIARFNEKIATYKDPPLSRSTIASLIRQYGWIVYNKKVAQKGDALSFLKKGTDMEAEAVQLLSKIDKDSYKLSTETIENDFLVGRCDIVCPWKDKVIDTKISWNVNSFLKSRTTRLDAKYWYQMQGYMELYNVNEAEVVFLLLNTPPELIEREKIKLLNRFMIGEIDRDKYEIDMGNIESAFTYSNLPIKRRHFRYKVKREPQVFDKVYRKVEKSRLWLQEFEKSMKSNTFTVHSDKYLDTEKNNIELDTPESD